VSGCASGMGAVLAGSRDGSRTLETGQVTDHASSPPTPANGQPMGARAQQPGTDRLIYAPRWRALTRGLRTAPEWAAWAPAGREGSLPAEFWSAGCSSSLASAQMQRLELRGRRSMSSGERCASKGGARGSRRKLDSNRLGLHQSSGHCSRPGPTCCIRPNVAELASLQDKVRRPSLSASFETLLGKQELGERCAEIVDLEGNRSAPPASPRLPPSQPAQRAARWSSRVQRPGLRAACSGPRPGGEAAGGGRDSRPFPLGPRARVRGADCPEMPARACCAEHLISAWRQNMPPASARQFLERPRHPAFPG